MAWEVGKFYKTVSGFKARIYAVDGAGYCIHGAVFTVQEGWEMVIWKKDGSAFFYSGSHYDWDLTADIWTEPEPEKFKPWLAWASISSYSLRVEFIYFSNSGPDLTNHIRLPHLDPPEDWQPEGKK